jgi:hypothetical protein
LFLSPAPPAVAGEIADQAAQAETLLQNGKAADALATFDKAAGAFWVASPLQTRVAVLADKVTSFANYEPHGDAPYHSGDDLIVYFEPFGFGFSSSDGLFKAAIAVDVLIRTPGGLTLAKSDDFGRLEWSGRSKMHEVHATVRFHLPDLKPGDYELSLTLRDQNTPKTDTLVLPFAVAK